MGPRVRILTDSVADLPRSLVKTYGIRVLPVYVSLNGQTYLDDGTVERDWFYQQLAQVTSRPTTASPSPGDFLRAYEALAEEGAEEIVALFTASSVSSLHDHAVIAQRQFQRARVHIVDTTQVSMGVGLLVLTAAEMLATGATGEQVVAAVEARRPRTRIFGVLESVDYLRRSGRVRWSVATMAGLLRIKPLIGFADGEAQSLGRVRTLMKGVRQVFDRAVAAGPLERLAVLHTRASTEAIELLQGLLAAHYPDLDAPLVDVGTVFASHVGPGCLGVALISGNAALAAAASGA